jgi:acyl-CoA synthetase (NDP forming)
MKPLMQELDPEEYAKLALCFRPEAATIIGASTNPMKFGGRALKFCLERGYGGRLYPVNAQNDVVQGVPAFRSVADLPEAPDIAVIAVPAPQVKDNLIAAGEKGAKIAIVYGAQFAEAGESGRAAQDNLLAIARDHGMRMIGPNCMGVISLASGFVASFTAAPEHNDGNGWPEVGSVSVASQSGAVGIQIFAQLRDRGLGLANWISTGNQADIDVADAIAFYAGDPATKTIAVYMEDASRGLKLIQALELARQAGKPVVILKVGTTPEGGKAAAGHTASMYVEDRLVDDLFAQYGVLRARSVNELIDLAAACNAGIRPTSPDVAAISVSGGGAVMISDAAARLGLNLPDYPADALAALKETNGFVNDRNPIDISAPSMSNMAITGGHLKWGLERAMPTMLGYISHVPLVPRTRTEIMPQLLSLAGAHPGQLIAIAANFHPEDRKALVKTGVAVFDDPTVATEAVAKLVRAGHAQQRAPQTPVGGRKASGAQQDLLRRLAEAGLPMAEEVPVASGEDAANEQARHGNVVLKLSATGLAHKTEHHGVRTGLDTPEAASAAHAALSAIAENLRGTYPDISIIASPMLHGVEVLLGVRNDPYFGALVLLGSGGVDCEILDDLMYAKGPIEAGQAEAMVDRLRVAPKLSGWRGAPAVDRAALVRVLVALSKISGELPAFEVNPAFVTTDGVTGADLVVET